MNMKAQESKSQSSTLPMAKLEDAGFSSEGLRRIHAAMQKHIDAGDIAGVTTLVARNGRVVYFDPQGWADLETKRPMRGDEVFNLASISKPVTAVAVLMMVDEGKIRLNDPVWKYLPGFKDLKVRILKPGATLETSMAANAVSSPVASPELLKADRDITIRDLLTHTSGLMSLGVPNPGAPEYNELLKSTLEELVPRFAVPLDFQPGTMWAYSNWAGFDVLARIVEITSGKPFDRFLKERLFEPLGMKDSGFNPFSDYRAARLAVRYNVTPNGLKKGDPPTPWSAAERYFSGAAGLSGSTEDYWRFMQMLANGGEFNGTRILRPETVELMRSNHVGDLFPGSQGFPTKGTGFGLGVQVVTDRTAGNSPLPNGTFGWLGASGCEGLASPNENIVLVFMVGGGNNSAAREEFHAAAIQAFTQ